MARRRGIGRTEVIAGIAIVAVVALVLIPLGVGASRKSRRAEVPLHVDAIKIALDTYHDAFDEYVGAEAAPRPMTAVDEQAVAWEPSPGFVKLAWAPEDEEVYGAYQIVATESGYTITGTSDVDGDGERAIFVADQDTPARMVTPEGVY